MGTLRASTSNRDREKFKRELNADLMHLRKKAIRLIDQTVDTQWDIQRKKCQLSKLEGQ